MICIFLFFSNGNGMPNCLAYGPYKRCNLIVHTDGNYLMIQMTKWGIRLRRIRANRFHSLVDKLFLLEGLEKVVCTRIREYPKNPWRPFWLRSCNELARYAGAVDIGHTWNPTHLFKKLLKYDNTRNYEIIHIRSRSNGSA
jgi:hypothetical protein